MDLPAPLLARIADALDRLAPPPPPPFDPGAADAFVWDAGAGAPEPVREVAGVAIGLLRGIEPQKRLLLDNTRAFAAGRPANNALLWGARGMGKSSLVKAAHACVLAEAPGGPALVEIARDDLATLPRLLAILRPAARRFVLFCDDLSFEREDADYKALKSVLDGGIGGRPNNVILYATSNRRHLMPREMIDNESAAAIHRNEAIEEKVSLSDRFGLWIGFHGCDQDTYLKMVGAYAAALPNPPPPEALRREALAWAAGRGARSGRVAWQFTQALAGQAAPGSEAEQG